MRTSIRLTPAGLNRLRVAHSPLWETLTALTVSRLWSPVPFPYRSWADTTRAAFAGPDLRPLAAWLQEWPNAAIPSFLLPVPAGSAPVLADELEVLRRTSRAAVRTALDSGHGDWIGALYRFAEDPRTQFDWLADALGAFHDAALGPSWGQVRTVVAEEILVRGRTLITDGQNALLNSLHPRIQWDAPELQVVAANNLGEPAPVHGLVLIPLLFSRGVVYTSQSPDGECAVSYQARGAAVIADVRNRGVLGPVSADVATGVYTEPDAAAMERLRRLIGVTRAEICQRLRVPTTTRALAFDLMLSPSTISEHLQSLLEAEFVIRQRAGSRVLYELSLHGSAVLGALAK